MVNSLKNKAQMKIQQMAFMIVAVLIFFVLVGLAFLGWQLISVKDNFNSLQKEQAIASIRTISDMPEFNCDSRRSLCVDEDKLIVMANSSYSGFWNVASISAYKILEKKSYLVYDSKQKDKKEFSTYVLICKKITSNYEKCDLGKLSVGVVNV